jgi:hypothetical protein
VTTEPNAAIARLAWIRAIRDREWPLIGPSPNGNAWCIGRRLRLLARLAEGLEAVGLLEEIPALPRRHLIAEQRVSRHRTAAMVWVLERVRASIDTSEHTCVLLKGAAYLGQDLAIAAGRLPSDVDIMVPRDRLAAVQQRLEAAGWTEIELDEHDRRYYNEWSHEVPPMVHPVHPIELDLHHNILPPMARTRVDMACCYRLRLRNGRAGRFCTRSTRCCIAQLICSSIRRHATGSAILSTLTGYSGISVVKCRSGITCPSEPWHWAWRNPWRSRAISA